MPGPRQTLVGDVFHMCIFKPVTDMPRRSAVEPRPGLRRRHGVRPAARAPSASPAFSLGVFQRNRSVTAPLGPSGGRSRLPSAPKDSMSQSATLPSLPTKPQVTTQILAPFSCSYLQSLNLHRLLPSFKKLKNICKETITVFYWQQYSGIVTPKGPPIQNNQFLAKIHFLVHW